MENKIKEAIQEMDMMDKLEEDIAVFYKETLEKITKQDVEIIVEEISDGKYGVQVLFEGRIFWMISKAWDTVREITINILTVINELQLI
ncbi:hypothetical protein CS063_14120 [Sporanaerobium hydrogeniformans]|uniref:Uncharacterized protein n=1 Tax=Sporanaerobium hydrogeniformans TaxID=3072179 RepID=A0AC61DAG3_9FIRM|nr:hypothetical protein [Sporanaerobium hydrogeniformans]PHV69730.1 hypothetical protein CS063_14120 [Sporanaerobium hydrogeniformans]